MTVRFHLPKKGALDAPALRCSETHTLRQAVAMLPVLTMPTCSAYRRQEEAW